MLVRNREQSEKHIYEYLKKKTDFSKFLLLATVYANIFAYRYFRSFGLSVEIREGLNLWFSDVFITINRHIYWSGNFREVWLAKFAKIKPPRK